MRKVLLLLAGTAVLCVPAVSVAGDSSPSHSKPAAEAESPDTTSDVSSPARACRSQRSEPKFAARHNGRTFTEFYGTNAGQGHRSGANAFGKCVSATAKHKDKSDGKDSAENDDSEDSADSDGKDSASPARICKAMQANDPAHFQTTYGTRPNAFGKCVARRAKSNKS